MFVKLLHEDFMKYSQTSLHEDFTKLHEVFANFSVHSTVVNLFTNSKSFRHPTLKTTAEFGKT